ncbi:hypothetical protein QR685DRAFT_451704, partial [Neurospora intermedia]
VSTTSTFDGKHPKQADGKSQRDKRKRQRKRERYEGKSRQAHVGPEKRERTGQWRREEGRRGLDARGASTSSSFFPFFLSFFLSDTCKCKCRWGRGERTVKFEMKMQD